METILILLVFSALSTVVSYGMEISLRLKFYKDVLDQGLFLNTDIFNGLIYSVNYGEKTLNNYNNLIPLHNIWVNYLKIKNYPSLKDNQIEYCKNEKMAIELDEKTLTKYHSVPSALKAYFISRKKTDEYLLKLAEEIVMTKGDKYTFDVEYPKGTKNTVNFYNFEADNTMYITGPLSERSIKFQDKVVKKYLKSLSDEEFDSFICKSINQSVEEISTESPSVIDENKELSIDELKQLKEDVLKLLQAEKDIYNQKPSLYNAIKINILSATNQMKNANQIARKKNITYTEERKTNLIEYFYSIEETKNIITKSNGPISKLSNDMQEKKLRQILAVIDDCEIMTINGQNIDYIMIKNLQEVLAKTKEDSKPSELSVSLDIDSFSKEELTKLKQELTEIENPTVSEDKKPISKTKRK